MFMAAAPVPHTEQRYEASQLWLVRGKYYDLSGFLHRHPGGPLVLSQSRGSDITAMVECSHFSDTPFIVMLKFEVPATAVDGCIPEAGYSFKEDGFFRTLKRRVAARLGTHARDGPSTLYTAKVVVTLLTFMLAWAFCIFQPFWWVAAVVAFGSRLILLGIGHEAIHGRHGWPLWHLVDAMFLFPSEHWHYEHVTLHHPHTKRFGDNYNNPDALHYDPDEDLNGLLRLNVLTPWRPPHRVQAALQIVLSMFTSIAAYLEYHLYACRTVTLGTLFCFVQHAPLIFAPDGGWLAFFLVVCVGNFVILHAFHLSHINENNGVYTFYEGVDWGEHQLRTSSNWVTSWYCISGMLEHQIEHHLFPTLSYKVQREIVRPLVQECAKEFGLPYYEYKSVTQGVAAHMGYMHKLGEPPSKSVDNAEEQTPYVLIEG
eukprot:TRINITY_DN4731_c0_g1_i1.p1 TRINITY_DN4731_c0_g1~~TRINITY_DN4731_c0_g1_i1.p1  ORF type:complete len:428 (-),score=39.03 TRINITY_DN4731_c0_g1_i1:165-1448(-)